jgi:hypothetical protein
VPKGWFFEIHEDTPEQEATNLMEHSTTILDISSDDDFETKKMNEDRGKENVPPPDFCPLQPRAQVSADSMDTAEDTKMEHVKLPRLRKIAQDAMDEDRSPLGDLRAADFYGDGLNATSYVTVDVILEKPSHLSKEFDFGTAQEVEESVKAETTETVAPVEDLEPVVEEVQKQEQEQSSIYSNVTIATELPLATEVPVVGDAVPEAHVSPELVAP